MRVVPHNDGSEFIFSLFKQPGMTEEQFTTDRLVVENDLNQLKSLLEG